MSIPSARATVMTSPAVCMPSTTWAVSLLGKRISLPQGETENAITGLIVV